MDLVSVLQRSASVTKKICGGCLDTLVCNCEEIRNTLLGKALIKTLPETIVVGDRTYGIIRLIQNGESKNHQQAVRAARTAHANLGEDHGRYIFEHQADVPSCLQKKFRLLFPEWRLPEDLQVFSFMFWWGGQWKQVWMYEDTFTWHYNDLILKRLS